MENNLTLLIKPAGGLCNLNCSYCFYQDELQYQEKTHDSIMSLDTIYKLLQSALDNTLNNLSIVFQGGEPLIAGYEFFNSVINFIDLNNLRRVHVDYFIQTNGTLITHKLAELFRENNFLVGVSLDGLKDIHDKYRNNSYDKVLEGIKILEEEQVDFNILCVVTKDLSKRINEVYKNFNNLDFNMFQFIPCLNPYGDATLYDYSLEESDLYLYLKDSFDSFYKAYLDNNPVSERFIDNLINIEMGIETHECSSSGKCNKMFAVNYNGDIYPCDFYMMDQYLIGSINESSIIDILNSNKLKDYLDNSVCNVLECLNCEYKKYCHGGCRRDRDNKFDNLGINIHCKTYKKFFEYAIPFIKEICDKLKK